MNGLQYFRFGIIDYPIYCLIYKGNMSFDPNDIGKIFCVPNIFEVIASFDEEELTSVVQGGDHREILLTRFGVIRLMYTFSNPDTFFIQMFKKWFVNLIDQSFEDHRDDLRCRNLGTIM